MHITGSTRVFLILGYPVEQVRAPEMFNHLFERHAVDAVLVPAQVAPQDLEPFVRQAFKARNIDGLWVTIPHKAAMRGLLDRCDLRGEVAQAVNAVRRNANGTLEGALFDGLGFVKGLGIFGVPAARARALVVGVGGAGVAIAVSLAERGVAALALFDCETQRCESVAQRIRQAFGIQVQVQTVLDPAGFDLVVNASPLGLNLDDPLPLDVSRLDPGSAVVDILMKNQPTPLLRQCHARGIKAFPGYEMMIQQASAYLDFFGLHELARVIDEDASEVRAMLQAG